MRLADRLERIMRFDNSAARTARTSTVSPPPPPPGRGAPPSPSRHTARRTYDAAAMTRLTYNWPVLNLSSDAEIRANQKPLRARSRDLAINNDYGRKFIGMVISNVILRT